MADVGNIGKFGKNSGVDLNTVKGGLKKEAMKTDEQKSIFDAVDADKNGVLDEKEVKAFKEKLDTSQDGVISKKEAKKFLKSLNLNEVDQKELLKFLLDYSLNTENVQDVRIKEENGQKLIEVVYKDGTTEVVHSDKSSEVTTLPDENGNVTTQFLTADKKLTKTSTTSANGDVTETEYAEDGETPVSSEITGKNGSVATISYEEGKPVSKQVKHGSTTSNYTYSEDGTEVLNSKIENEGVPTKERRIEYSYDENGVVTANITEQGKTTVQTIVDNKVQSETITEEGKTTVRTHNEDGTLTEEITTADGSETTVYNSENKKLSKTKVINGEEYTIQYDGEGNTVGIIVQNGESPTLIAKRFGCDVKDLLELNKSQLKGKGKSRYFNVAAEIKIPGEIEPDAKVLQGRQTKDEAVAAYKVTAEQIKAKKEAEAKAEADRIAAENKAKLDKENIALQKESAKQIYNDLMEAIDGINDDDDIYKALKQIDDPTEMAEVERLLQAKGYKADNYYSAVERFMQDELSDSKSYDKSFDEMEELVKTWISNGTLDGDKAINAQARLAARLIIDGCDGLGTDVEEAKEGVRLIKAPKLTGDPAVDNANAKKVYEQVENIIKKHKSFGAGFKGLKDYLEGDVTKAEIKYLDGILAQTNAIQGEEKAEAVKTLVKEAVEGGGTNIEELKQALMAINSPEDRKNIEAQLKEYCEEKGIKPQIEGQDYLQAILYDECDTFFGVSTDHDEIRKFNEMMIEQGAYTEEEITKLRAETAALQMLDGGFDNIQQAATTIKDKTTFAKLDELLKTKNYSGVEGFVNKSFTSQVNRDKVFAQFAANNLLSSEKTIQVATRLLQNSDYDTRALGVMSIRNGQVASGVDKALKEKGKSLEQILTKFNEDKAIYQVKAKVWDGLAAFGFGHLAEHISDEYRENTDMSDNLYLESDTPIELSQSQIAAYEMTVKTLEDGLNQMKADYQSALDSQGVVSGAVNAFCSLYNLGTTRDEIEARIEHEEETVRLLKMAAQGKLSKLENGKAVSVSFEDVFNERQSKVVSANGVTTENIVNLVKPKDVKFDVAKVEKVANKAQTIVAMDYAKDNIAVCWSELDRGLKANSNKELSVAICDTLDKLSQMSGKEMNLSAFGYEVKDGIIVDKSGKPVSASDLKEIANQLKQGLSDVSSSLFGTTIPANSSYDDVVDLLEDGYEDKMDAFKQEYRDAFGQDATDEMIENYLSTINTGKMIVNVGAAIGAVIAAPFTGGGSLAVFAFGTAASMGLNALEKSTDADGYTRTEWTSDAEQALWDGALAAIGFKVGVGADKLATQGFKEGSKLAKLANDLMAKNKALIKKWAPNLSPEKAEQAAVWMSRTEAAFGEISSDTAQSVIQSYCMEGEFNSESFLTGMIMSVAGNAAGHTFSAIGDSKAIHQKYQKPEITVKESHHQTPTLDNITGGGNKPSGIKLGEEKAKSVNDEIDAMLANPETNEVDLAEAYGKLELIQNRDVRRQAQAKIMAAVENLSDADKATFGILNTNRLKGQVDDIMSSGRPLETADVRVINDYIKNETDPVALSQLKEQLKAARSSKQGVTATYEALDVAITKRVGQLDVAPEVINEPTPAVKPAEVEPEVNNPIDEDIPSPASDARIDTPPVEKPKLDSKAKISEFYNKQLDNIKSVYSSVKNSEIPAKFKKLWNSCGERLDSLTALISKGSFNKVKSLATGLISDLNQIISSVSGSIKNKINNILTDIQNWTKDIIDDVEVLRTPKTGKVSGGVDVGTSVQTRPVDMKLTRGERVEISSNAKLILANSVEVDLSNPDIQARINNLPEGEKLFIGRAGNIRIDDNFRDVSRFHVQLQKIDGKLYVVDDSLNGTRLLDNVPVDQSNVNVGGNGRKASSDYNSNSKLSAEDYEKVNTLRDIFHPEFNDPALIRAKYPKLAHYSDAELLDMFKLNEEHAAFIKNRKDLFDRRMPDGQRIYSERSYWTDSAYELINDHCAWKMHLFSDTTADYQQMADIVIPYLLEHNIAHKTLSTTISPELLTLTSTKQSGKAFTIYPQSQAEMEMIARDLEKLIRENNLARTDSNIIGDNQLGSSGRMFYRYEFPTGKLKDNIYKPGERAPYEGNRGPGQYLASDMSVADDPWHNFDPANPNSKPGVGSSAPSPVSARGSNPVVNDFSNVEVGTMLPKGQEVIVGADANFLLANRVEFNFSDPTIRAQLDAMKDGDVITVGRSGDIQIDDPSNRVSRKHLEIRKQGDVYVVTDHSKVGTEVAPKIAQNHEGILDFFRGQKSGNDVKAVMKKVTGPDGTPKYTQAQINELLELSQVPISDEVLTELLKYPVAPEVDFYIKKQIIQQLKTPDDVQVLSSLMNIAKSDVVDVELRLANIGDIIDIANFDGKVSNPAEVFDKINTLIRNGKMDLPETRDALVILSKFLQSDEHKSFLMKLLDSFEQNDYRTHFWSYGDKLNSISAPLTIKNLNSLIEKYPDKFRPKYDDSGIIPEQTEAGIISIIHSVSPADDVAGFQAVLMNDLCAQGASIDRIAEVLSSFRLVGDMDKVPNPQAVVELMNRGASGRIIELAILRDLPASVLDNPALKYLEANNYKIDYDNTNDVLTLLSADLSTPQQIQAFNNLLAAKDLGIQPVEITTIVSSIKTDADVAKLQAMIDSGKIDTFKFLQDIKPTTIDVDVPTTPEVKPVTPEAAVQIRLEEIKRLNLTYGIDINHSSALVEMKINNPKRFAKIENSGLLDLIRDGKVNIKILQRLEDSPNMFFSNRTLEEIRRIANGEPLVPSIPKSEIEAISKHVTNGNVCEIDGALYVNDNGSPVRLKISKEAFENLFPPLGNVAFKQGNIGDCWFVSTLENLMDKPAGRVAVYNMFEQQGDDILVRFPGSQDAVLFNKGQLAYNGRGPAIQSAEGSDFSALAGTPKGVQMIEQAYAVHRLKSGARAYDANLNITDISKLTDTSALLKRMQGGTEKEAFCDLLGTPDVANTRDKTHFIRLIEQSANDPNFVVEFGTVEKPGFQIESDLDAKYDLYSTHAYAIKGYNPETGMVYISNPWSTHTITEVPMFELTKHMGDMTVVDLRSVQRADVSTAPKTVSTGDQHEGILDIFKKKNPVTTTSIVENLPPELRDLRARLLSSETPTTYDKAYFESWAQENGLDIRYTSNGTVAEFYDQGKRVRRITEDSTKPGMIYDDRISYYGGNGELVGGRLTYSWGKPLIYDVVDGNPTNMVTLDTAGNWVSKETGLKVNYNPITGMEAGMHGSVFGRIKDMFGGSSKQVDLSKNYDVSVSDAKIDYPNEGFVRSGQHQRALSSIAPSTVRNLDPSVNPRNIAQHVENGGVCSINGKLYANSNGNAVELKMSQETFERLFPEKGFATIKQRKGTNVCWLVSSLNSMATTVDGKIKIYSMIEELSDGSIKVQLAGPSKSFYIFPKGKALVAPEIQLGNGAAPGVEMIEQAVLANKINFPSGTSIDMDSCTNLVFAAGKMRTVSEAYELLGVSVKTCCNCQKSKSVDENIVKLHNFLKGRTWQDDVVTGTWNYHVRHITNYDPNTQMLTFHDPYFDGVDIQMPLDKFAATDPFIYSGTCGVSSRSQAKSHVVQQETPVQPSRPQRAESANSTRQSQIETTHSARAHVEQRAANIVSRNEWTKAGVDANGKEISVKQLSAGSVIVDRGGRKSVERFAEGQTRIELGKDANGVNLILTKSPDGDIRLSKLDSNGRASRLDNRANPEVKVETKTTSTTTSTSTSRVEDRTIKQRADVSVRPQVSKTPHFERRSTDLIGSWRDVATTADGLPISAKIKGDVVIIEKEGKFTEIPIAKGEEISVHETSTDSYLIIKREGYKTTITTSETPKLDGAVPARPTKVETPAAQAQSGTTPSKPKFLQSGVETEIGTINGKPLKAKYESLSADRVATIKINGKIYNVGPGTSLDVADGITIKNDKIGRVTFTNSQGADAPQVKPQERSSFADRFARRQEAQQPQDRGIGSFNPSRQPVQPSRPEVQATTEQPKTQTPSQNNGIGSFSSFSATRQVETPVTPKSVETPTKPADTPVRPESKSQSNGISSFDTPRQDVQASSSNTGIGTFGDVKPAMDRPAPTRKVTEDEIYEEMREIVARRRELQDEIDRTYDVKFKAIQTRQATLDVEFNEFNVQTRATIEQKRAQMNKLFHEIHDEKRLLEVLERQDRQLEQQFLEYKSALYDLEKKLELFEASHGRDGGSIGELYNYASEQRRRTIGAEFKDNMMEKVIPKNAPAYFYDPELAELFHAYNITTGDNKARVVAELREKLAEITRKYEKNTANLNTCRSNIESMEAQRSALSKDIVDLGEAQAQRRADYRAEKEALAGEVESTKAAKEQAEADVKNSPEVAKNSERYRELQRQLRGEIPMEEVPDEAAILAQQKEAQRAPEAQKSNPNGIGSFGGLGNTSTFSQRLNMSSRFGTVADVQPRRLPTPKTPVPSGYEVKGMMNYKGTECVYAKNSAGVTLVEVRGEWLRVRTL